jgi:hypothetical protein
VLRELNHTKINAMTRTIKGLILAKQRKDTPEEIAARIQHRKAGEQAYAETVLKFGTFTPENVARALAWQQERIEELCKA